MKVSRGAVVAIATMMALQPVSPVMAQPISADQVEAMENDVEISEDFADSDNEIFDNEGFADEDSETSETDSISSVSDDSLYDTDDVTYGEVSVNSVAVESTQVAKGWVRSGIVDYSDFTSDLSLSKKTVVLKAGELKKLNFSGSVDRRNISWSSSNTAVAQVDVNGYVYAVRTGSARITAWCDGKKQTVRVRVKKSSLAGESLATELYVRKGKTKSASRLTGVAPKSISYNNATNDILQQKGHNRFRGLKVGHGTVNLTSDAGNASVEYYVEDPSAEERNVTISVGESRTLVLKGVYRSAKWHSSKRKRVVVDGNGVIVGIKPGKARVTATVGGRRILFNITVKEGTREYNPDEHKDVVEIIRQSKYIELHMHDDGHYNIVQTKDYAGLHDLEKGTTIGDFETRYSQDENGNYHLRLTDLTDLGKSQNPLTIPLTIGDADVVQVDDSALNAKDVVFENGYNGMVDILPDTISNHIYENGDCRYRYVKDGDHLVVEIVGLTEEGKQKNPCEYPTNIHGIEVKDVLDDALDVEDAVFVGHYKDNPERLPDTLESHVYETGDFRYRYMKKDGQLTVEIVGLTESGKQKKPCPIPDNIHGVNISGSVSDVFALGTTITIGDFIYRASDDGKGIDIVGLSEEGKKAENLSVLASVLGNTVEKLAKDSLSGNTAVKISLPNESAAGDESDRLVKNDGNDYAVKHSYTVYMEYEQEDGSYSRDMLCTSETRYAPAGSTLVSTAEGTRYGFDTPEASNANISRDDSTECVIRYSRHTYGITLDKSVGVKSADSLTEQKYGKDFTVSAEPEEGYHIVAGPGKYTVSGDTTIKVKADTNTYHVSVTPGHGVKSVKGDGAYRFLDKYEITAEPETGYHITAGTGRYTVAASDRNIDVAAAPNNYTIRFDANNGTGSMADLSMTYDEEKNLTSNTLTRTGYTFLGWSTDKSATSAAYNDSQSVKNLTSVDNGTVTFYTVWKVNSYTATFNGNGGSNGSSKTVNYGAQIGTLPTSSRTGYTFDGWYTAASGGSKITATTAMGAGNVTYYAHWKANTYTITLNGNAGKINGSATKTQSVTYDASYSLPTPTFVIGSGSNKLTGTFLGWYTAQTGGTKWNASGTYATTGNVTLYAHWGGEVSDVIDFGSTWVIGVNKGMTWSAARNYAKSLGGDLAIINSATKQSAVNAKVSTIGEAWIGCTDEAREGEWKWVDGTRLSSGYTNWAPGEPNNTGSGEDYGYIYNTNNFKWNDQNGTQSRSFLVEIRK